MWSQAQAAVKYLHKLKVVLLATKHLTVPLNHQPSIHQLMVRWVVQRLHLKDKQEQHTYVAVSMATHKAPVEKGVKKEKGVAALSEWGGFKGNDLNLQSTKYKRHKPLSPPWEVVLECWKPSTLLQFASKKKREGVGEEKLHLEKSSVKNEEGLHVEPFSTTAAWKPVLELS